MEMSKLPTYLDIVIKFGILGLLAYLVAISATISYNGKVIWDGPSYTLDKKK